MRTIEIKLADVPEAVCLYYNTPYQGEIWLRSPPFSMGYYSDDKETGKTFASGKMI